MSLKKSQIKNENSCWAVNDNTRLKHFILACFLFSTLIATSQVFVDVAEDLNVSAIPYSLQYGSGMSFYDFNEDGWDDLSFTMVDDDLIFYQNQEGTFEQLSSFIYGVGEVKHLVWVDYDNDGDLDIALTTFENRYALYENDGNFNFTNVSIESGLLQASERYYGISFSDYDRDGYLDFYVTCYEQLGDESDFSKLNHLYHNNGDGTFTNVTIEAGVGDGIRLSFQGVWFDYDMDGWPDLFVINDRVFENSLYRNNGDGTFTDVSEEAGIQLGGQDPMTATVGDFDNDGDLDVFMTNTDSPFKRGQLLVNNGDGTFSQMAEEYGVDIYGWTWGAIWIDFDNDKDQDLYVVQGHPNLQIIESPDFLLQNMSGENFAEVSSQQMEGNNAKRSYSIGRGDFNNDGYYDMAVLNRAPDDVNLWQNSGGSNRFIKITLTGTVSNRKAIGSWIRVYIGGQQYTQYTMCGENYLGQNSQHHIFGLESVEYVDSVEVEYSLGHTDTYYNLESNSHYYFSEGETYSALISPLGSLNFCEGNSVVLDAGEHESYLWNTGHDSRYLEIDQSGFYTVLCQNEFGISTQSDTVWVSVEPEPFIDVELNQPSCAGYSDGSIFLENALGSNTGEFVWGDGLGGSLLDSIPAGNYSYQYTDSFGCSAADEVVLTEPAELSVFVTTEPETEGGDGAISLIINGGNPPYTVFLDEEEAGVVNTNLSVGNYLLEVFDNNGCAHSELIEVGTAVSSISVQLDNWRLFPNPASSGPQLRIDAPKKYTGADLIVFDLLGRVEQKHGGIVLLPGTNWLPVDNLRPGVYFISIYLKGELLFAERLIVVK